MKAIAGRVDIRVSLQSYVRPEVLEQRWLRFSLIPVSSRTGVQKYCVVLLVEVPFDFCLLLVPIFSVVASALFPLPEWFATALLFLRRAFLPHSFWFV